MGQYNVSDAAFGSILAGCKINISLDDHRKDRVFPFEKTLTVPNMNLQVLQLFTTF